MPGMTRQLEQCCAAPGHFCSAPLRRSFCRAAHTWQMRSRGRRLGARAEALVGPLIWIPEKVHGRVEHASRWGRYASRRLQARLQLLECTVLACEQPDCEPLLKP